MFRGVYAAASGMHVQQLNLDVISNNLANMETPGYKKDTSILSPFQRELLFYIDSANKAGSKRVGHITNGVEVREVTTSFKQGELEQTGNLCDVAIEGDGFFVVQYGNEVRLTRNGSFKVDGEGYLVTGDGFRVLGQEGFIILNNGNNFTITEEGIVIENGQEIARLLVVDFENRAGINKEGKTLFTASKDLKPVIPRYRIKQGYLERSNLNLAQEITDMILTMRTYEANQRLVQMYDQMLGQAVKEIGSLK